MHQQGFVLKPQGLNLLALDMSASRKTAVVWIAVACPALFHHKVIGDGAASIEVHVSAEHQIIGKKQHRTFLRITPVIHIFFPPDLAADAVSGDSVSTAAVVAHTVLQTLPLHPIEIIVQLYGAVRQMIGQIGLLHGVAAVDQIGMRIYRGGIRTKQQVFLAQLYQCGVYGFIG